ncbi:hypothetical protein EG329_011536 [Mollisiaceae sp. DMI_Dod_QoI]|nr:hypothetical protein EG329_011536 [Helotiales sp. DMI_Dod_QoI]
MKLPPMTKVLTAAILAFTSVDAAVTSPSLSGAAEGPVIQNHLNYPIYVVNVLGGQEECGALRGTSTGPIKLKPGKSITFPWSPIGCGTAVKVSKSKDLTQGHFAFEYDVDDKPETELWINLSDVDGTAPGQTGTTFKDAHVYTHAKGKPGKDFVCHKQELNCFKGEVCTDAYQWDTDDDKVENCAKKPKKWVIEFSNSDIRPKMPDVDFFSRLPWPFHSLPHQAPRKTT